ncbi:uncharacterized protein C1orf131 homolog [Microplitis mediator]|uniref:uncharacterized protein C1orf131 homolog n=1 Tax=Microplitis mediator TaxID=375433 RepID=UPI002556B49B|nr:uncharacterized protein C1orf131 homolog [Microplitis mediator]
MSGFVMTRAAQVKKNAQENFVAVTYTAPKKKIKKTGDAVNKINEPQDKEEDQEKEMKRLRWDVMKFGSSGFEGAAKHKAKVALAISLGAKPPKNRRMNYKNLKLKRSREKEEAAKEQEHQSGLASSLKKTMKKKRVRKETGILDVYGKVPKRSRDRTK